MTLIGRKNAIVKYPFGKLRAGKFRMTRRVGNDKEWEKREKGFQTEHIVVQGDQRDKNNRN